MVLITENEIEFYNFLNDGYQSGAFKLKLKRLNGIKEVTKFRMLVFKKRTESGVVTLYGKDKTKKIGVYMNDTNTLISQNANQFVSLRIKYLQEGKLTKATVTSSPEEEPAQDSKDQVVIKEQKVMDEAPNESRINAIRALLSADLQAAKKVWAILSNADEVQVENNIFEASNITYLGNSKTNVDLMNVKAIKFRGKLYLD